MIPLVSKSEHFWKNWFLSPIYIEVVYTYDGSSARDQKHGFLKFWTLNFENGVKWSSGTTLDDSPKKIPTFLPYKLKSRWKFFTLNLEFAIQWDRIFGKGMSLNQLAILITLYKENKLILNYIFQVIILGITLGWTGMNFVEEVVMALSYIIDS